MKYTQHGSPSTASHFTEKRSVADTLLETISETLGQGGLRPAFSAQATGRRGRGRQFGGALAMLMGLAAIGAIFLSPSSNPPRSGGEPVAFLEIARGRVEMSGAGGRGAEGAMLMLAGGEAIHAGAEIETGTDAPIAPAGRASAGHASTGRAAIRLAGGQSVRLDRESRVRFATSSSVVLERGAVYIDSADGDNIEVRTALGVVRDIGTQFEVRLLAGSGAAPSLQVRVRKGSVELEEGEEKHVAVAGEELRMHADGRVDRGASSICGAQWSWALETAPAPNVTGRPLRQFIDWASQEACWTVRFVDQATADIVAETILHGDVRDLTLIEAASVALHGSGLDYSQEDGAFIIGPMDEAD